MSGIDMPAAFSISVSASTNGMPSRCARRRPTEDLPAPIMPTSTTERRPRAAAMAVSGVALPPTWCVARLDTVSDLRKEGSPASRFRSSQVLAALTLCELRNHKGRWQAYDSGVALDLTFLNEAADIR